MKNKVNVRKHHQQHEEITNLNAQCMNQSIISSDENLQQLDYRSLHQENIKYHEA